VAAFEKFGGPLIIVDFGTATTFDAVSKKGEYLGGAIFPGIQISLEALFKHTAKLPRIDMVVPENAIVKSTAESIRSGADYGFAGMIEGVVRRMKSELGENAYVVGTGGIVEWMDSTTTVIDMIDPFLTLEGLRIIYERNHTENLK
jgi:type III pantothenate kinase